ncbi:SusC/RagA family TonB-linked outer membrane protein [Segetibacter sp. 3557_3]|uniref:SusC/RagA family TonB-linked outer membrane protein n=1 Tax=Segetibacter sp. 3557_3 TaxID=2547429 RepID=UPI001404E6ED|nr:SusC/RagA family TonB-linked outer membrane protein [Segetibacter sp. 3557_3]
MRKLLMLMLCIVAASGYVMAQSRTITGRVLDDKGNPVASASVSVKNSTNGTVTTPEGTFSLSVPASARAIVISSVGLDQREVPLTTSSTYSVTLSAAARDLAEIIVTGYTRERRSQFVGAATVISGKAVETVPVGSFDQALQGRAPGLLVNSGSGQPGASASITIRGVQSITGAGSQPLYVLDGVPLPSGAFQSLNSNDFESMTVLKDASAAALYGSRAGQGVIVITSKKGRAGGTNLQYRTQIGFTQRPQATNFDMMNTAEILSYEEREKVTGTPGWNYSKLNPAYANLPATSPANAPFAPSQARYNSILDSIRGINTDVLGLFFRQGISQQHELNVSGGTDKTRFYLSGSYFDQEGTDIRSQLKRYATRFNIEHSANNFTLQFNNTVGFSIMDQSEGEWYGNSTRNTFQMSWRAKPYENPYKPDGTLNYGSSTNLNLRNIANAMEGIQNSTWRQNQIKLNSGLTVIYRLLPTITLKNTFGIDVNDDRYQRWVRPDSYIGSLQTFQKGANFEAYRIASQMINTSSVVYAERFDKHEVEVGGYFEAIRAYQKALGFTLYNLDPRLPETGQGAGPIAISTGQANYTQTASSARSGYGIRSFFGMGRYSYNNKYSINGAIRRDETSRILDPKNKGVTTWSLGGIWNAIQEDFIKSQNWLSDLKVRASYGSVANIGSIPVGNYGGLQSSSLTSVTNYISAQVPAFGASSYAGSTISGLVPTTPGNPNMTIEYILKQNLGVDVAVFKNRARLSVDVYKNLTKDMFVTQSLPGASGFVSAFINAGSMSNKGVELAASVDIIRTSAVDLTFSANHAFNKNNIEDLGLVDEYESGTFLLKEGLPYGTHYTYRYLGADPATGRPIYETLDGKTTNDLGKAGRFSNFGTYLPKHVGGFNLDFRLGDFSVAALFSYQFGVIRSNNIESWVTRGIPGYAGAVNQSRRLLTDQWQKPGDEKFFQASLYDRDFTSADLQDAKFLRFRNLNVSYRIPAIKARGLSLVKSARMYVQMQNLWIWSPWKGPDPEDNNNISLNEYPNPRMIVTGIDINF